MSETSPAGFEIGDGVLFQTVQDEVVLLSMTSQQYYGLNSVGARMWQLLLEHRNIAVVADRLRAEYDVDENTLRRDIESMVRSLQASGLLKIASASAQNGGG